MVNIYEKIAVVLKNFLYNEITLNIPGIHLALRQEQETGYAVVTLDETGGVCLSREQLLHISEQIRDFLRKRSCYHTHFLYLLVTEDDSSMVRLFENFEGVWRIAPYRGQLMVYEHSDYMFQILRQPLEEILAPAKYADTASSTVRQNTSGYQLPWCNLTIIAINLLIFLYTDFFSFNGDAILDQGALGWQEVLVDGQWYRLLTSIFLHIGIDHIFNNMLVLGYIGSILERQIGHLQYGILYLLSGILAGAASMVYNMMQNSDSVSVGASGAIFGTVGAMLYLVIYFHGKAGGYTLRQVAVIAFFGLYSGFTSQGVDNAAHVGGFIAGFVLAALLVFLSRRPLSEKAE